MEKKRAFVRYSKQGKVIPGSLILTDGFHPNELATWKEVPVNICGGPVITSTSMATFPILATGFHISLYNSSGAVDVNIIVAAATVQQLVQTLNYHVDFMGTFKVNPNGVNIDLYPSSIINKIIPNICSNSATLSITNI